MRCGRLKTTEHGSERFALFDLMRVDEAAY
jgi:hypothetical protein